jgi:tetratricopeptide (TPR) repeat protein
MKTLIGTAVALLGLAVPCLAQQNPAIPQPLQGPENQSAATSSTAAPPDLSQSDATDAYYNFAMGHLAEEQYEATGKADYANQAIDSYKKALMIEPNAPVIMERLAEIYAKTQRIRLAVSEAQDALELDPDNLDAHRLLARIYVRLLGDLNAGQVQQESLERAVDEFQAILRIDPTDDNSALWLARLYRFENQHDKAEAILRDVLKRDADNEPALEQLSQLLLDEGRPQDAIDLLNGAAQESDSPGLYDLLGNAYSQIEDNAKSEAAYRKAVDLEPDDPGHRRGLAQALIAENKYQDALDQYQRLSQLEPESAENFLRMAQIYRRMNKLDQAQASLDHAKQLAPGSLEVMYAEALLYENEMHFDQAAQVLADAIAGIRSQSSGNANPNALGVLYEQLGRIYVEGQKYDDAVKTYDEMAQLGAGAAQRAEILKIDAYRESHDIDRALTESEKALAASPKDQELIITHALLLGDKGKTADAVKSLRDLMDGSPNDEQIYVNLAQVQEQGRQFADAEESAKKAEGMANKPEDKETAWFLLGAVYQREKKYDLAEQEFRKVLDQNPTNAATLNFFGYMLADRGVRLEEATSLIQRAVDEEPVNGAYLDSLGWAYYKQNKLDQAQEYLSKAVDLIGNDPTILGHLADCYLKLGENERAAETYEKALAEWQKAFPGDYEADKVAQVEQQLKTLKKRTAQKATPGDEKE